MRWFLILVVLVSGCVAPKYSERAYSDAITAKVDGRHLVESSGDSFRLHAKKVSEYRIFLIKAYEYARGRGKKNMNSRNQWAILATRDGGSVGEYLYLWEKKDTMDKFTRIEFGRIMEKHFDQLIELERARGILK